MGDVDCSFFPEDPSCQAGGAVAESEGSDYYQMVLDDEAEFLENYGGMATMAKIGFLALASQGLIYTGLKAFRVTQGRIYYMWSDTVWDGFNWQRWANYFGYYGSFGLFAIGWITQLLDLFGVASGLNWIVWGWVLGTVGPINAFLAQLFLYLGYEMSWNCAEDESNENTGVCAALRQTLWDQLLEWMQMQGEVWAMAYGFIYYWIAAQWEQMPEEKKEKYRARVEKYYKKKYGDDEEEFAFTALLGF